MIERSYRFIAQRSGFALAVVVASAVGLSSHALAASPERDTSATSVGQDATKTIRTGNVSISTVVNRDDGDPLDPDVRHHWPTLDDDGPLGPLVRHHWP